LASRPKPEANFNKRENTGGVDERPASADPTAAMTALLAWTVQSAKLFRAASQDDRNGK
jgi:hypothetical protein